MTTQTAEPQTTPILHLQLGPLDLDLLGVRVQLNQVVLDIDALAEPGALVGNLLTAVSHLLDAVALGALLEGLLDNLLGAVTRLLEGVGGGAVPMPAPAAALST